VTPLDVVLVGSSPWPAELADDDLDLRTALELAGRLGGRYDVIVPCGEADPGPVVRHPVHVFRVAPRTRAGFVLSARRAVDRAVEPSAERAAGTCSQVLMSSDPLAAMAIETSRARRRRPHIFQVQGEIVTPGPEFGGPLHRGAIALVSRVAVRRASGVRVVRQGLRAVVEPLTDRPVAYVGSRVDTAMFAPGPAEGKEEDRPVDTITVGALEKRKNHDTLVRAWARVVQVMPGARLLIVGEGSWRPRLEVLVDALGLRRNVELRGSVTHREVAALLRTAKVLAHPAWSEGQPRAVLEGMAAGLPVVCSDIPEHREIVSSAVGRLVAPGDADRWAETIGSVLRSPATAYAMGVRGRAHVVEQHDLKRNLDRFADFVRTVAAGDGTEARRS
jgi:glycosyltransferase involved in cell wall biosynthesis